VIQGSSTRKLLTGASYRGRVECFQYGASRRVFPKLREAQELPTTSLKSVYTIQTSVMASTSQYRVRGRPAHTAGPTALSYTPDGTKLVTVGSNNTARVYHTGSDGEPANVDEIPENNFAVASTVCTPQMAPEYVPKQCAEPILCCWFRGWNC
jgi:WD40 repeat protein